MHESDVNARGEPGRRENFSTTTRPLMITNLGEGKIHRVDPDFRSTLTVSNRDYQSNCWVNWKIMGQPCEFQVEGEYHIIQPLIQPAIQPSA
jgi:hypothetical protein